MLPLMSWREAIEPDWFHEAPFYVATLIAHGALLTLNPAMQWGSGPMPEKVVPVEFVAEIPRPQEQTPPELAPPPPALARGDDAGAPKKGAGELEREKVKRGAVDAPPKKNPVPKPAAVKSKVDKRGATINKARATAKAKPVEKPRADPEAVRFAKQAQAEAKRLRAERAAEDRAAAQAEKARKSEIARALAFERAEAKRIADEEKRAEAAERAAAAKALAAERAEAARVERERRAQIAREEAERRAEAAREAAAARAAALAEKKRLVAEAKAAKAAKRAELSRALATMDEPDEVLEAGSAAPSGRGSARKGKPRAGVSPARSGDGGDAFGGDTAARGGGEGPDGGGGVSWSVDGPVGDRRLLSRVSPQSPDWVATRSLDLTVTVRFQVLPDGKVKAGAVIQKTSGFPEIDQRALDALRRWRFQQVAPKPGAPEVWGRVTFRFTS